MAHEKSEITLVAKDDAAGFVERARQFQALVAGFNPEKMRCLMLIAVGDSEDQTEAGMTDVNTVILGDDGDIARMLTSLIQLAKNGITAAHTETDHSNETKH